MRIWDFGEWSNTRGTEGKDDICDGCENAEEDHALIDAQDNHSKTVLHASKRHRHDSGRLRDPIIEHDG